MASTKNSQKNDNLYALNSLASIRVMQATYFSTLTNNARSYQQKLDMIQMICFLTQKMNQKDPEKYPNATSVLGAIFDVDFSKEVVDINGSMNLVRSFGMICDNLMWGTCDNIEKPEGITNAKEIKNKIINYFTEEWAPF